MFLALRIDAGDRGGSYGVQVHRGAVEQCGCEEQSLVSVCGGDDRVHAHSGITGMSVD